MRERAVASSHHAEMAVGNAGSAMHACTHARITSIARADERLLSRHMERHNRLQNLIRPRLMQRGPQHGRGACREDTEKGAHVPASRSARCPWRPSEQEHEEQDRIEEVLTHARS